MTNWFTTTELLIDPRFTLVVGVAVFIAGLAVLAQQVLSGPNAINYPGRRAIARLVLFVWGVALIYRGFTLCGSYFAGHPIPVDWSAVPAAMALPVVQLVLTWDTLTMKLPARWWRRLDVALRLNRCEPWWTTWWANLRTWLRHPFSRKAPGRPPSLLPTEQSQALATLSLSGIPVAGPNETLSDAEARRRYTEATPLV